MSDNNFLTDLFGIDFSEFAKSLANLGNMVSDKYNDFVNDHIKKYDLNTQEGYENFIKDAAELRKEISEEDNIFSPYLLKLLDNSVKYAMNSHKNNNEKEEVVEDKKEDVVEEIVNHEISRNNKDECNETCKVNLHTDEPEVWPSDKLTPKEKRNIWRLVDEYVDSMIIPYIDDNFDEDAVEDMGNGLFEFAAWLLKKE